MLVILLLLIAALCFGLAMFNAPVPRVNLPAAGLFFWVLSLLVPLITKGAP
jgi:hypothetical protein